MLDFNIAKKISCNWEEKFWVKHCRLFLVSITIFRKGDWAIVLSWQDTRKLQRMLTTQNENKYVKYEYVLHTFGTIWLPHF